MDLKGKVAIVAELIVAAVETGQAEVLAHDWLKGIACNVGR